MPDLETFDLLMPAWENAQEPMARELRWETNFPHYGQSLCMHANSVPLTMRELLEFFRPFRSGWNELLLITAILVHDHGEPLSGGDEDIESQTKHKAVREWHGFAEMIQDYPESIKQMYLSAFALQYAIKDCDDLPVYALAHVEHHREFHMDEAWFFDFVECIDYFRSARVGARRNLRHVKPEMNKQGMFEHVHSERNLTRIDRACDNLPVLREFWTPQLQADFAAVAKEDAQRAVPAFRRID